MAYLPQKVANLQHETAYLLIHLTEYCKDENLKKLHERFVVISQKIHFYKPFEIHNWTCVMAEG